MAAAQVLQVPRAFHANFASSWRRYLYLFPLQGSRAQHSSHEVNGAEVLEADGVQDWEVWEGCGNVEVDVQRVDEQLRGIRGQALHFTALAYKEVKNLGESPNDPCGEEHANQIATSWRERQRAVSAADRKLLNAMTTRTKERCASKAKKEVEAERGNAASGTECRANEEDAQRLSRDRHGSARERDDHLHIQ